MQLKLIGELASGIWHATSGNKYTVSPEGVLEIPDDNGTDCEEAKACGLFETERLGGSSPAEGEPGV